jgi:antitoxin (DNA-binding transcriptional repressor) of toxin-antitoxin stability system
MFRKNACFAALALAAGLMGGLAGSSLTAAPAKTEAVMATGEMRLVDGNGRTRLLLTLVRDKPRLLMLDEAGEYRLEIGLGEAGEPHIWLRDREGAAKIQAALTAQGRPAFRLVDQKGRERAALGLSASGHPTMIFRDDKGRDRLALWREQKESGLALANGQGRPVAALIAGEDDRPRLTFFDDQGQAYRVMD